MLSDKSVLEWATGWLRDSPPNDPTFRQRFLDGLALELKAQRRRGLEEAACIAEGLIADVGISSPGYVANRIREAALK
jgi:hypothetical protein